MKFSNRCIQANLQHAKAATYVLSRRFKEEQLDIAFIQEQHRSGPGLKPRACILIRNYIQHFMLTGYCTADVTAAHSIQYIEAGHRPAVTYRDGSLYRLGRLQDFATAWAKELSNNYQESG
ncbi:hypothetical protein NQ315_009018 [Exocentrus adspersus]|uniref:Uncharacterized protein n=1 Tax=Exocentrus adspersus TaxID=1586481 RepID=A0AAV8VH29_9CUCU|nr:hypothetical protein NQ315_009018 [Exocentrus adspersus]